MMNKVINKIRFLFETRKRQSITRLKLMELKKNNDIDVQRMASVIDFIIYDNRWSKEEKIILKEVDKIEKKYLSSTETIKIIDFGAGLGKTERSQKEQEKGVESVAKISDLHKIASSKKMWGKLMFKIIREFKPTNCLELGTNLGISASYQILGLKLNGSGRLTTIEGSKEQAKIANESLKNLKYPEYSVLVGKFSEILPDILDKNKLIDFAFIDGHHDMIATKEYFELLYPFLSKKTILIFDDINYSSGMKSAWKHISNDSRVNISFDLYYWGFCFIKKEEKLAIKNKFKLRI